MKAKYSFQLMVTALLGLMSIRSLGQQKLELSTYSGQAEIKAATRIVLKPGFHTNGQNVRIFIDPSLSVCTTPPGSVDQNYIRIDKIKVAGLTTEAAIDDALCDNTKVNVSFQYFDGLGRMMQSVQYQGSPEGKDIITPIAYDNFGREDKKYLPYVSSASSGNYRPNALTEQPAFYNSPPTGVTAIPSGSGQVAYSQTRFEESPLNRVMEQGFPGGDWKIGGGHTQRSGYGFNGTNDVRLWQVTGTGADGSSYYPKSRLYADTLTDENGNRSITYTDLQKKVVLKRSETGSGFLSTYYVYDEMENLRYVIPPGFGGSSFNEGDTGFAQYIYAYRYNGNRQVTEKKIPGRGWEYFIYDVAGKLVMSQDAVQRGQSPQQWTIMKYDMHGRLVLSALYSHAGSTAGTSYLSYHQGQVNGNPNYWETKTGSGIGYSANTYPGSWDQALIINYYNTYSIPGKTGSYDASQTVTSRTQGLLTGSKVNILGTSTMLLTVNYYDERGRVLETVSDNHLGGIDRIVNSWNFADELTASTRSHSSSGGSVTIANRYEYDPMGRKTKTYQQINSDPEVLLADLDYNELGQLRNKALHNGSQTVSYGYNARGWLTGKSAPLFAMQLKYNDGGTPRYNGDITQQLWGTPGSLGNSFSYTYDRLNRLLSGDTGGGTYEKDISYDGMGNITSLNRDGTGTQSYSYNGNQLGSVSGGISRSYTYDANGNATSDGTFSYTYNHLNLPSTMSGGASIAYTYDALGKKLRLVSNGTTIDYVDGINYITGAIDFIQTEEGLARKSGSNYLYEYALTDHLGSNRLSFDIYGGAPREIQHQSYYPFGKIYNSYTLGIRNNYLYNGKELQGGLEQYDFGARFYDPLTGRWNVPDPLSEKYAGQSPFDYVANNPVSNIDPDGRETYTGDQARELFAQLQQDWRSDEGIFAGNNGKSLAEVKIVGRMTLEDIYYSRLDRGLDPFSGYARALSVKMWYDMKMSVYDDIENNPFHQAIYEGAAFYAGGEIGGAAVGAAFRWGKGFFTAEKAIAEKGSHLVYQGIDKAGIVRYVGITEREAAVRFAEHLNSGTAKSSLQYFVIDGASSLTRTQARVWEQTLINQYGLQKNGGLLLNKINSIAQNDWWQYGIR